MNVKIKGFESYRVCSVYLITEYKDGCVYKTEFIGYSFTKDVSNSHDVHGISNIDNIYLSDISTSLSIQDEFELEILTRNEIVDWVNTYYETKGK